MYCKVPRVSSFSCPSTQQFAGSNPMTYAPSLHIFQWTNRGKLCPVIFHVQPESPSAVKLAVYQSNVDVIIRIRFHFVIVDSFAIIGSWRLASRMIVHIDGSLLVSRDCLRRTDLITIGRLRQQSEIRRSIWSRYMCGVSWYPKDFQRYLQCGDFLLRVLSIRTRVRQRLKHNANVSVTLPCAQGIYRIPLPAIVRPRGSHGGIWDTRTCSPCAPLSSGFTLHESLARVARRPP